jgi:hypothetical protein
MKYFFSILICLILFSCVHQKKKIKNELETLHYYGKVKIITYKIYKAIDDSGKIKKGMLISKIVTHCDSAGYFVEQSNYKGDKLIYQATHKYDSRNNLIEEDKAELAMQYLSPGDTKPDSLKLTRDSFAIKYDDKGNKAEVKVSENGKPWYRDVNVFDDNGNILEEKEYIPWDTLDKKETFKYDDKGNMLGKVAYHADSSIYAKYEYQYDDKGNIISLISYRGDGSISTKEIMKYDEKNNKTADSCNKRDGTVVYAWRYKFTAFDEQGNWINETTYAGGEPQTLVERTIEYYK